MPERIYAAIEKKRHSTDPFSGESRLRDSGEVVVTHKKEAEKSPEKKQIHPRRPLPPIPDAPPKSDKE